MYTAVKNNSDTTSPKLHVIITNNPYCPTAGLRRGLRPYVLFYRIFINYCWSVDGSPCYLKPDDKNWNEYFIWGKKPDAQANPSYISTIFPKVYKQKVNVSHILAWYISLIKRRSKKAADSTATEVSDTTTNTIKI